MSLHSGVAFNHSCIRVPVNPDNKRPYPLYERWSHRVNKDHRLDPDIFTGMARKGGKKNTHFFKRKPKTQSLNDFKDVQSFLHFYESIPDFNDLNHLSDEEFYNTLKRLKNAQREFFTKDDIYDINQDILTNDESISLEPSCNSSNDSVIIKRANSKPIGRPLSLSENIKGNESDLVKDDTHLYTHSGHPTMYGANAVAVSGIDYFKPNDRKKGTDYPVSQIKQHCLSPKKIKPPPKPKFEKLSSSAYSTSDIDSDGNRYHDKNNPKNPLTVNCVNNIEQLSNPESYASSLDQVWGKSAIEDDILCKREDEEEGYMDSLDDFMRMPRSLPGSPILRCKFRKSLCTVPKPFNMTLRVERDKNDKESRCKGCENIACTSKSSSPVRAHPVPFQSRVPLYDKIMAEQELRRRKIHRRHSKKLQSSIKPFSFTERDQEEQRRRLTCSNPELSASPSSRPESSFRAKPVPRHLFSNYAYERMREDEFYRALKKRVRAEEMLKAASLPPSMAAREKLTKNKSMGNNDTRKKSSKNIRNKENDLLRRYEFANARQSPTLSSCNKSSWLPAQRGKLVRRHSTPDSSTEASPSDTTPEPALRNNTRSHSSLNSNRNNLASVLRLQTCRKRMEMEISNQIEESQMKEEAKFKARLVRMTPAWRALNYSTEEDLALRVAARREEERLRREKHRQLMEDIYGRVHLIPPLFERHSTKYQLNGEDGDDDDDRKFEKSNDEMGNKSVVLCDSRKHNFENDSQLSEEYLNSEATLINGHGDYSDNQKCSKHSVSVSCTLTERNKQILTENSNASKSFKKGDYSSSDEDAGTDVDVDQVEDAVFCNE